MKDGVTPSLIRRVATKWKLYSPCLSLSDCRRYGRRFVMLLSIAIQAVFRVAAASTPSFTVYVVLRFVVGTTMSGVITPLYWVQTNRHD